MRGEFGGGLSCYECGHVWPDDEALIADHNALMIELGEMVKTDEPMPLATTTEDIYSCPQCTHDF